MKKRLLEFLVEWHEVSEKPMPSWLKRRLKRDLELRESYQREKEITRKLSNRDPERVEPNPYLAERIIANLDGSERTKETDFSWKPIPIAIAAGLAVFAVVQWNGQIEESGDSIAGETASDRGAAALARDQVPIFEAEGLLAGADWENPLDQEIERVFIDAKGAVGFLAESFLPSTVLDPEQEG